MDNHIHHDPTVKRILMDAIYGFIYEPVKKAMKRKLDAIIIKNSVICGNGQESFNYKGVTYQTQEGVLPRPVNRLHKSLHPNMDAYLEELQQFNEFELPYVTGFIRQVLNASDALQDYLLVFPKSIHKPIQGVIDSCPYRTNKLTSDDIAKLQEKNQIPIDLMKQRMVMNLITPQ